jgi:cellulose synthase/poly-beta-1,6-N-acetylglucosamine synthase-like glycosyltransferase
MTDVVLMVLTLLSCALVVYHHALYPVLLKRLSNPASGKARLPTASTCNPSGDAQWPDITIIVPAFNEGRWIAEKIRNLAALDYPPSCFQVIIACDGCQDDTAAIALATAAEPICQGVRFSVHNYQLNRGKVAVINQLVARSDAELILLTDVSALLSIDSLRLAALAFRDPSVGVVNSHYQLWQPESKGEQLYWRYQCELKLREAALGATLGTHGAGYVFRRRLFRPLAADTINDDFVLPMQIVAQGYRAVQHQDITSLEMEASTEQMDFQRRTRISAGNVQQLWRLRGLLHPRHGGLAFAFASGKGLRVAMPYCMLTALVGSLFLAPSYALFMLIATGQILLYGLAAWAILNRHCQQPAMQTLSYLVSGHFASLCGSLRYAFGLERGRWQRVSKEGQS